MEYMDGQVWENMIMPSHQGPQHNSLGCLYHCITRFAVEQLRISALIVFSTL